MPTPSQADLDAIRHRMTVGLGADRTADFMDRLAGRPTRREAERKAKHEARIATVVAMSRDRRPCREIAAATGYTYSAVISL